MDDKNQSDEVEPGKKPTGVRSRLDWLNKQPYWMFAVAVAGIVGLPLTVWSMIKDDTPPSSDPVAQVPGGDLKSAPSEVFVDGARYSSLPIESGVAYCANSFLSTREDVYTCLIPPDLAFGSRIKVDPCFSVDDSSVVCAKAGEYGSYGRFNFSHARKPAEDPFGGEMPKWPWQLVLEDGTLCDRTVDSGDFPEWGDPVPVEYDPPPNEKPMYSCGQSVRSMLATKWTLKNGDELEVASLLRQPVPNLGRASGIEKGADGRWMVMHSVGEGQEYFRVGVRTAVF